MTDVPFVDGIISADQVLETATAIAVVAAAQRHDPVVPRRPRRPLEPRRGGHGPRPRRACTPRPSAPTSGWSTCSTTTAPGTSTTWPTPSSRTSSTPTPSPTSPPASGTAGSSPATATGSSRCGRVVEKAIDFVLDLQTPRGEILWARHADGTPWSFALLTGSSSHLPQPALRHRRRRAARPRAPRLGAERRPPRPGHPGPLQRPGPRRLRPQGPLGHGLVLPGARRRAPRRRGPRPPRRPPRHLRRRGPRRALRVATGPGSPPPRPASA